MAVNYRYSCPLPVHPVGDYLDNISVFPHISSRGHPDHGQMPDQPLGSFVGTVRTVLTLCGALGTVPQLCPPQNFGGLAELLAGMGRRGGVGGVVIITLYYTLSLLFLKCIFLNE